MDSNDTSTYLTKAPSYLCSLFVIDEIILIHKDTNPLMTECYGIQSPLKKTEKFLDITGSPLKVDLNNTSFLSSDSVNSCTNLWQKIEEKHYPIPYDIGKKLIQEYLYKNSKNKISIPTWWILDGSDKEKTVLMSVGQLPSYIRNAVVKLKGYLPKSHPTITFEALCNKHFEIVSALTGDKQKVPLRQLKTIISNTYELCGSKIITKDFDAKCNIEGSVYLEISWDQCCAEIPLDRSESIMTIQTVVGQQNSILSNFWNELILLELYIKTLNEYNSETMLNNHWLPSHGVICDDSNLIDEVIAAVQNYQSIPKYGNKADGLELQEIIENVEKRFTWDITDQLWMILNNCSTYGSLTECLNIFFTEIMNSDRSIYIADANMNSMAQIIRDIALGKSYVCRLTGTQPIEVLIEIGLDKIRKDFIHIFSQFGIAFEQDFQEMFIGDVDHSSENIKQDKSKHVREALYYKKSLLNSNYVDNRIKVLGQLHTVLETLILVPKFWQLLCARNIFEHFVGKDSPIDSFSDLAKIKLYEISIKLPTTKVYEYIKSINPITRRLSLTSSKPIHTVKNVFHLSQIPIFPPAIYKSDLLQETMNEVTEPHYHYTLLTEMINFIKTNIV